MLVSSYHPPIEIVTSRRSRLGEKRKDSSPRVERCKVLLKNGKLAGGANVSDMGA